ncbi:MAG: hypothetical protein LBG17_03615 [Bacteroidales bacterium]|jgi:ABC-type oligopeptide transport system substrate-binding subunit|nr:hypothetical protein [Bacteroidales bacterium]
MRKKLSIALMFVAAAAFILAAASCSSGAKTSSSTQDSVCDFVSRPGKQHFYGSKPKHHPAPETPIGRR